MEAEYIAWFLRRNFPFFHFPRRICSMFAVCLDDKMSPHINNIGLPYLRFTGKVYSLEIEIQVISSEDQFDYQFTKGLCREKFENARLSVLG